MAPAMSGLMSRLGDCISERKLDAGDCTGYLVCTYSHQVWSMAGDVHLGLAAQPP